MGNYITPGGTVSIAGINGCQVQLGDVIIELKIYDTNTKTYVSFSPSKLKLADINGNKWTTT